DEDKILIKPAGCNAMSVGIFSWLDLESEDGRFTFDWLDVITDKWADNGAYAVPATPSGSPPVWLSRAYPEVCRSDTGRCYSPHAAMESEAFLRFKCQDD
ncbi:MAG: beta-galactosidase, partial [Verrucomicrobiota bacterium]